jgi:hypothetical protein
MLLIYFSQFDNWEKADIYKELVESLERQLPNWWVQSKVTCCVNNDEFLPDVGAWQRRPLHKQRRFPIIHSCPPPLIWIEVKYNFNVIGSVSQ